MDRLLHVEIELGQARALVAETTELVRQAQRLHGLSHTAAAALGRALTGAVLLGCLQKNQQDRLTLTFRGDGPLSPVVCVADGQGRVKGCLENPQLELPLKPNGKLDVGGGVGHTGRLTVVRDLGLKEPYVGQTNLSSGEIAEDLALYLTASEQTPSLVALGVRLEKGVVCAAGGVLVQPLPGCTEEVLQRLEGLAPGLTALSDRIAADGSAAALVEDVFAGLDHQVLEEQQPAYRCDCSRERIERALLSMGREELQSLIEEQHGAEVCCHFCDKRYNFTQQELEGLLRQDPA